MLFAGVCAACMNEQCIEAWSLGATAGVRLMTAPFLRSEQMVVWWKSVPLMSFTLPRDPLTSYHSLVFDTPLPAELR